MRKSRNTEWASFVDQWKTSPRNMRDVKKGDVLVSRAGAQTSILAIPMKVTSVDRTTTKGRTILQGKNLTPTGSKPNQWRGSGATSLGGPNSFKVRVIHSVRSRRLPPMTAPNPKGPRKKKKRTGYLGSGYMATIKKRAKSAPKKISKGTAALLKGRRGKLSSYYTTEDNPRKKSSALRRSMTIRKGSKTLKILPQARGMVKAVISGGAKAVHAIFSSAEEALKWGLAKIGLVTNPQQMKVIRAIRNGASAGNPRFKKGDKVILTGARSISKMVTGRVKSIAGPGSVFIAWDRKGPYGGDSVVHDSMIELITDRKARISSSWATKGY